MSAAQVARSSRGAGAWAVAIVALLCAGLARAGQVEPGALVSTRTGADLKVDGRLDEGAWAEAQVFSGFVESFPTPGKAPDLTTEARVLHDDTFLYIGVRCRDPRPELIVRNLGRRDSTPFADRVDIALDSAGDRRTAYMFSVNAAGVLRDQLLFANVNATDTWDAVWQGAATVGPDGWSVEVAIPLRTLRFDGDGHRWGVLIRRVVPRTHQTFDSKLVPREANPNSPGAPVVSAFGALDGLSDVRPGRSLELLGYAAPKLSLRPQFSDPLTPTPRLVDPSLDLGVDFKVALTSKLLLTGTINPDFGQVEADQIIQNLSTAEAWFPEKRPFFQTGLDLFQPVGAEYGSPQQLFYSRRIGLHAPILAAVKLTGSATSTLDIGLLDAVVMGVGNPASRLIAFTSPDDATVAAAEARPDRRFLYHWQTPLHFGPEDELPFARPVTTNYLAAVARQRLGETASLGAVFTAATPLADTCGRGDFASAEDFAQASCQSRGVNALGLDWSVRTKDNAWGFFGQVEASQQVWGDPAGWVLPDGTRMKPGDLGFGGNFRAGKLGGEPFRFDVSYVYEDKKLDLNGLGFQNLSNYQWADLNLHYVRPNGAGPFHNLAVDYNLDLNWSADAQLLPRGVNNSLNLSAQLPSYDWVGLWVGASVPQYDTREIESAGVPFERAPVGFAGAWVNTDANRPLAVNLNVSVSRLFGLGATPSGWGWSTDLSAVWHPLDALETRLEAGYGHRVQGVRWLDTTGGVATFGLQDPEFLTVTLRQQVVLTPTLTFQVYAQLFSGRVLYGPSFTAALAGRSFVDQGSLVSAGPSGDGSNFHTAALNLNAVLRWEYRLGSTLYFVYTRSQQERALPSGAPVSASVWPSQLFSGPATDTFLVKWTYWLSV